LLQEYILYYLLPNPHPRRETVESLDTNPILRCKFQLLQRLRVLFGRCTPATPVVVVVHLKLIYLG